MKWLKINGKAEQLMSEIKPLLVGMKWNKFAGTWPQLPSKQNTVYTDLLITR